MTLTSQIAKIALAQHKIANELSTSMVAGRASFGAQVSPDAQQVMQANGKAPGSVAVDMADSLRLYGTVAEVLQYMQAIATKHGWLDLLDGMFELASEPA